MSYVRKKGEKTRFWMLDSQCIGRGCFQPGQYHHRAAAGSSGSRATGQITPCCMQNAYRGCPTDTPDYEFDQDLAAQRKREGWKNV